VAGYANIRHIETGEIIAGMNSATACEGHLYAVAAAAAATGNGV
jgi:hypothetical protein